MERRAAFPPARIVVVLGDLVEAELLVVVGADPFGRVDRALLQRRIDVAAGNVRRDHAELGEHRAAEPADAELDALQVVDGVDLLAPPAAHLAAGVAGGEADHVELGVELVQQVDARRRSTTRRSRRGWRGRTARTSRTRRSGPCRNSSSSRCGPSRRCCSAPRRRRRASARSRRWRMSGSGICRRSARRRSWRSARRRRRACRATSESPRSDATSVPASTARWRARRASPRRRRRPPVTTPAFLMNERRSISVSSIGVVA